MTAAGEFAPASFNSVTKTSSVPASSWLTAPLGILPGQRAMRLAHDLYRIPDVAVFAGTEPDEGVPSRPPLVAVEIVSRDDRYSEVLEKLAEYQQWGVTHIWVVDPHRRTLATYEDGALRTVPTLALPGYPFEISADLFS
ncbi:MAG: Uma2 family endonuclease [Tepidisphaeraceae bacterium]